MGSADFGQMSRSTSYIFCIKRTQDLRCAGAYVKMTVNTHAKNSLNYIGFVKGKDIFQGNVDVVACDEFTGNIVLKTAEGVAESMGTAINQTWACLKNRLPVFSQCFYTSEKTL